MQITGVLEASTFHYVSLKEGCHKMLLLLM